MDDRADIPSVRPSVVTGSPNFGELVFASRKTSNEEIDQLLLVLQEHKEEWVQVEISERISILDAVHEELIDIRKDWINAEIVGKAIRSNTLGEAEEWVLLATIFRAIDRVKQSLLEIEEIGHPRIRGKIRTRSGGQVVAQVYPETISDRLLFQGVKGEVWMEPGVPIETLTTSMAPAYHDPNHKGKVALVLGAGNATTFGVIDLLHKLFVELQVVVLKPNPVNSYMGPLIGKAFQALIERSFLGIVYGGAIEGSYLCNHPHVEELHMTGSDKTYEAIVFGGGSEGERRKSSHQPINTKRFTGELGNITPVIVVPGPWDKGDIEEQAKYIATWFVANAGFACLTPRVIIQHATWPFRNELLDEIGRILENFPIRKAYYPGAEERFAQFIDDHPNALQFGEPFDDHLPWTLITGVDSNNSDDICFKSEAFCSLYAETTLDAPSVVDFIERAVKFANETLWGTLSVILIVHPKSLEDPKVAGAVEQAISELRYGTVSINMIAFFSAYLMVTPWGAFPGHDIYDIQSGIGKNFNFLMFAQSEKSVIKAPFKRLDPLHIKSKRVIEFTRRLADYEASPRWWKIFGLAREALLS